MRATPRCPPALGAHAAEVGAGVVAVSARIEGELAELDPAEAEEMRESYGVEGSGLARLVARRLRAAGADHLLHRR